jgi:hypothetical protein
MLFKGGDAAMISGQAVVDGALDAIARAARRNSPDIKP